MLQLPNHQVYEGQDNTEAKQPTGQGIQRRRSRMNSIFTVNGSSPVEPYRKLILEVTTAPYIINP